MQLSALPASDTPLFRRLLMEHLYPHRRRFIVALICMGIASAMTGVLAWLMEPVINRLFIAKEAAMLVPVALGVLVCFVVRGAMTYIQKYSMANTGQRIVSDLQKSVHANLLHADLAFFHANPIGQIITRLTTDIGIMRQVVSDSATDLGKNMLTLVFLFGVMLYQEWRLTLITFIAFPLMGIAINKLGKKMRTNAKKSQNQWAQVTSLLTQTFQGIRQVKAYGMEDAEKARLRGLIDQLFRLSMKAVKFSSLSNPLSEVFSGLAVAAIIMYGGHQVIIGQSTPGEFFSFITAFTLAYDPMRRLSSINSNLQQGLASAERVFAVLDLQSTIVEKPDAQILQATLPTVELQHVSFAYGDELALNDVSMLCRAGQKTAIVGPSGAGKSTILNLIPRFYDVQAGQILIDGQNNADVTLTSLRKNLALVSQDVVIFDDTVAANIAYGTPDASQEEIMAAAQTAAAHDFIMALPKGYNTVLGEQGTSLSGGQRQRLAIARAVLRNAPILLLDEATSALDNESEKAINAALKQLEHNRTTIVIAHRLSTVIDADMIYVMEDGRVADAGTHADLVTRSTVYQRLYGTQLT